MPVTLQQRMTLTVGFFFALYFLPVWGLWFIYPWTSVWVGVLAFVLLTALVVGFLYTQYQTGKKTALHAVNAVEIMDSGLNASVEYYADELGITPPKVMIGEMGEVNAFSVGRQGSGVIVLSNALVETLPDRQIDAVIVHELSHLKSRDTILMLLGECFEYIGYYLKYRVAYQVRGFTGGLLVILTTILNGLLKMLILPPLRLISRKREYVADLEGAKHTSPEQMAQALTSTRDLNRHAEHHPATSAVDSLCIYSKPRAILDRILNTHPPVEQRLRKLKQFAEKEGENQQSRESAATGSSG